MNSRIAIVGGIVCLLVGALLYKWMNFNSSGTAAVPGQLPCFASLVSELKPVGQLHWAYHADRLTHRVALAVSGSSDNHSIDAFVRNRSLQSGMTFERRTTVENLEHEHALNASIIRDFDRGDETFLGRSGGANIRLFIKRGTGEFTIVVYD